MRITQRSLTKILFGVALFLSSGAMEAFTATPAANQAPGSLLMKLLWAPTYVLTVAAIYALRRELPRILLANKAFVCLTFLALFSFEWSISASATLSRGVPLLLSAIIGLEFARRYSLSEQLRILLYVLVTILVLGVIAQLCFPDLIPNVGEADIDSASKAWHGILTTKNSWARLIVLTGIVILSLPRTRPLSWLRVSFAMVLIYGLLAASRSVGGMMVMTEMTVLFLLFPILRWRRTKALVMVLAGAVSVAGVSAYYLVLNLPKILVILGKDPTMTGRIPIWQSCLQAIAQRPWLGYGYSAFWTRDSRPARLVREAVHWNDLPHAHNGYLDLLLGLGIVGLALYVIVNVVGVWRAAGGIRNNRGQEHTWPLAFFFCIFLYQLDEGSIIAANQILWIMFSAVMFSLSIPSPQEIMDELPVEPQYETVLLSGGQEYGKPLSGDEFGHGQMV